MSRYETVEKAVWADPDFETLPPDAKLLYLWSFTNPLCNMAGLYKVSETRMQRDTGLPGARASKALGQLVEATFLVYERSWLWVRSRVKYMTTRGPKMAAAIASDVGKVDAAEPVRHAFLVKYGAVSWLREALREGVSESDSVKPKAEGVSIPLGRGPMRSHCLLSEADASDLPIPSNPSSLPSQQKQQTVKSQRAGASDREDTQEIRALCHMLADLIEGNGSKRPSDAQVNGWRREVRLMVDQDGRSLTDIEAAIRWSTQHPFWRSNVLSMRKLREQFDQLRLQAQRDKGSTAQGNAEVVAMLRQQRGEAG